MCTAQSHTTAVESIIDCDEQHPLTDAVHAIGDRLVGIGDNSGTLLAIDHTYLLELIEQIKRLVTHNFSGAIQIEPVPSGGFVLYVRFDPDRQVKITAHALDDFLAAARRGELDSVLEDAAA